MTNVIHICSMRHGLGKVAMNMIIKAMNIINKTSYPLAYRPHARKGDRKRAR